MSYCIFYMDIVGLTLRFFLTSVSISMSGMRRTALPCVGVAVDDDSLPHSQNPSIDADKLGCYGD